MTIAVDMGRKATKQTNKQTNKTTAKIHDRGARICQKVYWDYGKLILRYISYVTVLNS